MIASFPSDIGLTKICVTSDITTSDVKVETFLVKLFQIVKARSVQENNNLCKQMIAEAFHYSEEEPL